MQRFEVFRQAWWSGQAWRRRRHNSQQLRSQEYAWGDPPQRWQASTPTVAALNEWWTYPTHRLGVGTKAPCHSRAYACLAERGVPRGSMGMPQKERSNRRDRLLEWPGRKLRVWFGQAWIEARPARQKPPSNPQPDWALRSTSRPKLALPYRYMLLQGASIGVTKAFILSPAVQQRGPALLVESDGRVLIGSICLVGSVHIQAKASH